MTTSERFLEIQELFHAALKLPPAERQAFLITRCPQDESLKDEVEALLVEDADVSGPLRDLSEESRFTIAIGTRLGAYEVTGAIGAGGMGEVYRARDSKLNRDVALKILPESFAADPERIFRFRREAQLLASLNHPNIAAIYGLEESSHLLAIAMELVEGPTLAERMSAGAIPVEEALAIAKQMAEALEAAHDRGIIHRDLKPANVKITPDGVVKVLDFGLGKDLKTNNSVVNPLPTRKGLIMGTAPYMSPEQARGGAVDKRADIWAFGVVLYEMVSGSRLFAGETTSDTLAAVLAKEPDWNRAPLKVQRMLRRCLEKDPKRRLRDIADAWALLDEVPQALPAAKTRRWKLAGVVAVLFTFASWIVWRATRPIESALQPLVRLDVDLGSDVSLGSLRGADAIISPDGRRLVYVSQSRLFTRRLDQATSTELAGTQYAHAPFFSPDGQWVAFFADSKLKKVSLQGGPPIDVCDAPLENGGSWGEDGNIIASLGGSVLSRIPSNGGTPGQVTELAPGEEIHRWPHILPGGKAVLFSAYASLTGLNGASIEVVSLGDRRRKTLLRGGAWVRYAPGGYLIYINKGVLLAVSFDLDRLEVRGVPIAVLDGIAYSAESGFAQIDVSRAGTLVYRSSVPGAGLVTVQLLDGSGKDQPLLGTPGDYFSPTLSQDGNRLALTSGGDIWVYDLRRETMTRLTIGGGFSSLLWSRDGRYIACRGARGMLWIRADGSGKPQPLIRSKNLQNPWSFMADGSRLAFVENNPASGADIWTVSIESDVAGLRAGTPEVFLQTPFNERAPAFSPDGRWLAYFSDESGRPQIYVRAFPRMPSGPGAKRQISNAGGTIPVWSPNGHELFFLNMNHQLMVAPYSVEGDLFLSEKPRLWSERKLGVAPTARAFDVAPDGKHVVATMSAEDPQEQKPQHHVIFLLNFFDELRRRASLDGQPIH